LERSRGKADTGARGVSPKRHELSRVFLNYEKNLGRTRTPFTPDFRLVSSGFRRLVKSTPRIVCRSRNYHIPCIPFVPPRSPFVSYPLPSRTLTSAVLLPSCLLLVVCLDQRSSYRQQHTSKWRTVQCKLNVVQTLQFHSGVYRGCQAIRPLP
jgi:hypothetical protein